MERVRTLVRVLVVVTLITVLALAVTACSGGDSDTVEPSGSDSGGSTTATDATSGEDPTVALIETKCSMCHSTDRVWAATQTREEWVTTIDRMKTNGLVLTEGEYDEIVEYLSTQ